MRFALIHSLSKRLGQIDLNEATEKALKARENDISELNRDQLREGKTANGVSLPNYSIVSVEKFGKPFGPIKLFDTGDFYDGIVPEFAKNEFSLKGTDEKTKDLQFGTASGFGANGGEGYGEDIIGLSKDSVEELAHDSLGQIQFEIKKGLGI